MERQAIDFQRASEQHRNYETKLCSLGFRVVSLPPAPPLPDAVFVEDTAVVVAELAVIAAPARPSRRNEVHELAKALEPYRPLRFLSDSATLEGGDIILQDKRVFIGLSTRTNVPGACQLQSILRPLGYFTRTVVVSGCLHLSTAASYIGRNTILANPEWVDTSAFEGYEVITLPRSEPWAANVLLVKGTVLMPNAFPQTRALLERSGFAVAEVEISEFQKAEAGITCMSLRFETNL
jgi:dimethylargininase